MHDPGRIVSTGKAAELCCVKPDTVLKWIKCRKIEAIRTAGGHYRIHTGNLSPFIHDITTATVSESRKVKIWCWDFYAKAGRINPECKECVVYKAKSERCFVLARYGRKAGHEGLFCKDRCDECRYYKYLHQKSRILIVSRKPSLYAKWKLSENRKLEIQFACCGYELSKIAHANKPHVIVMDYSLPAADINELSQHVKDDPDLGGVRLVVASNVCHGRRKVPQEIDAVIRMPFDPDDPRLFTSLGDGRHS